MQEIEQTIKHRLGKPAAQTAHSFFCQTHQPTLKKNKRAVFCLCAQRNEENLKNINRKKSTFSKN
tara:strand:- start:6707 stop:6901 length:195 start_codon:yes stop_codon:yes gene_type:complete